MDATLGPSPHGNRRDGPLRAASPSTSSAAGCSHLIAMGSWEKSQVARQTPNPIATSRDRREVPTFNWSRAKYCRATLSGSRTPPQPRMQLSCSPDKLPRGSCTCSAAERYRPASNILYGLIGAEELGEDPIGVRNTMGDREVPKGLENRTEQVGFVRLVSLFSFPSPPR